MSEKNPSEVSVDVRKELDVLPPIQREVVLARMKKDRETNEILNKGNKILSPSEMFTKMLAEEAEERVSRG